MEEHRQRPGAGCKLKSWERTSRVDTAKEKVSELKDTAIENIPTKSQREKSWRKLKEQSLCHLWNIIKCPTIHVNGAPEKQWEVEILKKLEEIIDFSPNLIKRINTEIQEVQWILIKKFLKNQMNKITSKNIIIKSLASKDKKII